MCCGILAVLFLVVIRGVDVQARWDLESSSTPKYDWGCGDYDPATNSSLFAYLWCSSTDLAEANYQTGFIQGIKSGLLYPRTYAAFDLQDAWGLDREAVTYGSICDVRTCDEEQNRFFDRVSRLYKFYEVAFAGNYKVDFSGVTPNTIVKTLVAHDIETSRSYEAQYSIVLVTPYLYIWSALAQRLEAEGALKETNVYNFWIEASLSVSASASRAMELLDNSSYVYDKTIALKIFRGSMQLEAAFLASATPEAVKNQ